MVSGPTGHGDTIPVAVFQSGRVPSDTATVSLYSFKGPKFLNVELSGTLIPLFDLGDQRIGGDVSAFAGKVVELRITGLADPVRMVGGHIIDDIQFSSDPLAPPETADRDSQRWPACADLGSRSIAAQHGSQFLGGHS